MFVNSLSKFSHILNVLTYSAENSYCHLVIVKLYCKTFPRMLLPDSLSVNKSFKFQVCKSIQNESVSLISIFLHLYMKYKLQVIFFLLIFLILMLINSWLLTTYFTSHGDFLLYLCQ